VPAGTLCRAATGDCDVADLCDGTTTACPDAVVADGTACTSTNACATNATCQAGVCVASIGPGSCSDPFLCYGVVASPFSIVFNVHLVDEIQDLTVDVTKFQRFCTPADEGGNGLLDPLTHMETYGYKKIPFQKRYRFLSRVRVENAFHSLLVDTRKPDALLVPTAADLFSLPPVPDNAANNVDHYTCYKASLSPGTPRFSPITVSVGDEFTAPARLLQLIRFQHLCMPVSVNGQPIKNPDVHLACYLAHKGTGQPAVLQQVGIHTNNELGPLTVSTVREGELCVPAHVTLPAPPTTPPF